MYGSPTTNPKEWRIPKMKSWYSNMFLVLTSLWKITYIACVTHQQINNLVDCSRSSWMGTFVNYLDAYSKGTIFRLCAWSTGPTGYIRWSVESTTGLGRTMLRQLISIVQSTPLRPLRNKSQTERWLPWLQCPSVGRSRQLTDERTHKYPKFELCAKCMRRVGGWQNRKTCWATRKPK